MSTKDYRILLFYKYVKVPNAEEFTAEHLQFCKDLGVKGRILIADQGINGTLSGTVEQTDAYMAAMHAHPLFSDLLFKIDEADGHAFQKIFVRYKKELVTLRYDKELDPNVDGGARLTPKQFHEKMQQDDVIILDGRSDYEYDLGHFRGAIKPDLKTFREFPEWIRNNLTEHKDKPILTYCTGGIRCEMLTAVLKNEGFGDVPARRRHCHVRARSGSAGPRLRRQLLRVRRTRLGAHQSDRRAYAGRRVPSLRNEDGSLH